MRERPVSFGIYLYRHDARGLMEADRQAVRAALARWGWDGSEESPYCIGTADGISVEFYASGLDGSEPFYGGNLDATRAACPDLSARAGRRRRRQCILLYRFVQ